MKKHLIINNLFCLIIFLLCSSFSICAQNHQTLFFNPSFAVSSRLPISAAGDYWKRYNSAGLSFEFPSKINNLHCVTSIESGHVFSKNEINSVYLLHIYFGVQYCFSTPVSWLKILPQISLTNTMESDFNSFDAVFKYNRVSFADVENEYGVRAGIEPRIFFHNFFVGFPVIVERTFSTPDPFDLLIFTVKAGYSIKL